jgi:hypothetical protein
LDNEDPVTPETRVCEKWSEWPWSSDAHRDERIGHLANRIDPEELGLKIRVD